MQGVWLRMYSSENCTLSEMTALYFACQFVLFLRSPCHFYTGEHTCTKTAGLLHTDLVNNNKNLYKEGSNHFE